MPTLVACKVNTNATCLTTRAEVVYYVTLNLMSEINFDFIRRTEHWTKVWNVD